MPLALVMNDIMCQYGIHLMKRVEKSGYPFLTLCSGALHRHWALPHQWSSDSCLPCISLSYYYIPEAKQVDGEIIETLWATLYNMQRRI